MTTAIDDPVKTDSRDSDSPASALDTGPQAVLALAEQGMSTREIATTLHMSQPTVTRRIKEATENRQNQRRANFLMAMIATGLVCLIILTAAMSTIAWVR